MSDLFRKEALEHRSRALFGEVVLRGPISTWILTALIIVIAGLVACALFLLDVQTDSGPVQLIDFLMSGGR